MIFGLLSFTIILRSIRLHVSLGSSMLFIAEQYSALWIHHSSFILSPVGYHLVCYQFGAITSTAAMNICVQVLYERMPSSLFSKYQEVE